MPQRCHRYTAVQVGHRRLCQGDRQPRPGRRPSQKIGQLGGGAVELERVSFPHATLDGIARGPALVFARGVPIVRFTTDREMLSALRAGAGAFVVGFARRHRVDGMPAGSAAVQALRDMAHRAIGEALGIPELARAGRKRIQGRGGQGGRKRPTARKGRTVAGPPAGDRESDRVRKMKRYLDGTGPDPGPERGGR
jgi:hypothetical protein